MRRPNSLGTRSAELRARRAAEIVGDNGTADGSRPILGPRKSNGVAWYSTGPGKPMQGGFVKSFTGRFRDEGLDGHVFAAW